jgi:hypothetical protein
MAAGRGTVAIFDFGPPVEELRRRCLDETGLPTPVSPRFTRVVHPPAELGVSARSDSSWTTTRNWNNSSER